MTFGFQKLAMTQLGTTVAARVSSERPTGIDIKALLTDLTGPTALELEWRKDSSGQPWLFEVNVRFPSWIGALGTYGLGLLRNYVDRVLNQCTEHGRATAAPQDGSIFYRLPQSGFLPLETTFRPRLANWPLVPTIAERQSRPSLLWESASPHKFLVK